jgi:hypothetical protein
LIKAKGRPGVEDYLAIYNRVQEYIDRNNLRRHINFLINDLSELSGISGIPVRHYKTWLKSSATEYSFIYFYGLSFKVSLVFHFIKFVSSKSYKLHSANSLDAIFEHINKYESDKLHIISEQIDGFLNRVERVSKPDWSGSIDNGRLKYSTEVIDGNVFIRRLEGKIIKGDTAKLNRSLKKIIDDILPNGEPFYLFFDVSKLKAIKIGAEKKLLNGLQKSVIVYCCQVFFLLINCQNLLLNILYR